MGHSNVLFACLLASLKCMNAHVNIYYGFYVCGFLYMSMNSICFLILKWKMYNHGSLYSGADPRRGGGASAHLCFLEIFYRYRINMVKWCSP